MRLYRSITGSAVVAGLCVVSGATSPGRDGPTPSGYQERCAGAMAPALGLRPAAPAAGDARLRRLMKLRYASAFRRLEIATERVKDHQDPPEKLLAILDAPGESRLELCDDPSALIPVQEARLGLARLIGEIREGEAESGRAGGSELEGALYPVGRRSPTRSGEGRADGPAAGPIGQFWCADGVNRGYLVSEGGLIRIDVP